MPKLPSNIQKAADEAESRDFGAIPGGLYRIKVKEIDTAAKSGAGNDKWVFVAEVIGGPNDLTLTDHNKRQLWEHAALTEPAAWKIKQIFEALGFTLDSDADELLGETCLVMVSEAEIEQGARKGQMGNNIDAWLADTEAGGELVGAGAPAKGGKSAKKDDF